MKCKTNVKVLKKSEKIKIILTFSIIITQLAFLFIRVNAVNVDYNDEQSVNYMSNENDVAPTDNNANIAIPVDNNDNIAIPIDNIENVAMPIDNIENAATTIDNSENGKSNTIVIPSNVMHNYLYNILKCVSTVDEQNIQNIVIEKTSQYENGDSIEKIIEDIIYSQKEYLNTLNNEDFIKAIYNGILLWEPCTTHSKLQTRYFENILYEEAMNKLGNVDQTQDNINQREVVNQTEQNTNQLEVANPTEYNTNQSEVVNQTEYNTNQSEIVNQTEVEKQTQQSTNQPATNEDNTEDIRYKWVLEDVLKYDKFELLKEQMAQNPNFNFEIIQQGEINLSSRSKGDINPAQLGITANDVLALQRVIYERTEFGGNRYDDYINILDVDENGVVDTDDITCIATYVGRGTSELEDLNGDGVVNFEDFVISYNKEQMESKSSFLARLETYFKK